MIHELSLGVSAMRAAQVGLDTVGQNLSNADTPGYHRQVVSLVDRYPTTIGKLQFGNGVEVESIRQIRSNVIEQAIFGNIGEVAESSTRLEAARRIEALVTPGDGSLTQRLDAFFGRLESLSARPGERTQREGLIHDAVNLTNGLHNLVENLDELASEIELQIRDALTRINDLSQEIADLNERIETARLAGIQPNDFIDRRDARVAELATLIDTELREQENSVTLAGGPTIFNTGSIPELQVGFDGSRISIEQTGYSGPVVPQGGRLAALLAIVNETLPAIKETLNEITRGLIATVDRQHVQGLGIDGAFETLTNERPIADFSAPLASLETALPINNGQLVVAINGPTANDRVLHTISINAETQSLTDVAAALNSIDHFNATINVTAGKLTLAAEAGYTFDFTGITPAKPDTTTLTGTARPEIHGTYNGTKNDEYRFEFLGSGTIGVTDGLKLEVTDKNGTVLAQLNVGSGYEVGSELELPNELSVKLSAGTVVAGESFSTPVIADSDSSQLLAAFGFNTFFTGDKAGTLEVREALRENSDLLATSRNGNVSDSSNLNKMVLRRSVATTDNARLSVEQFTQRFVTDLGRNVQEHDELTNHLSAVQENLKRQQASVSGVDTNEELVHMLQFQRSFQTAARYITVISEVTAELMDIIG